MSLKRRFWVLIRNKLPKRFVSAPLGYLLLDHIEPFLYMDNWSTLPFNGQARRMRFLACLSVEIDIKTVIETGTYLGSSTPYLAGMFNCKTYTVEINHFFADRAKKRFEKNHKNLDIELLVGDSTEKINEILSVVPITHSILAYLDAHWLDAIPTQDEILALIRWGGDWIAVIDDFHVSGDSGYKFDSYKEVVIGVDLIPADNQLEVWVPKEISTLETGVRSGTGIVFSGKKIRERISHDLISQLIRIK
jgi:predicted O-methyltransferase YrrM